MSQSLHGLLAYRTGRAALPAPAWAAASAAGAGVRELAGQREVDIAAVAVEHNLVVLKRAVFEQVLDLDGDVIGHVRVGSVQGLDDADRVRRPVEEIGVAKGDVPGARGNLTRNIREHDV
jgi:hypothetical protein